MSGPLPGDPSEEDFKCFTCAFSKFVRKPVTNGTTSNSNGEIEASDPLLATAKRWDPSNPDIVPDINWRNGRGVQGGWTLEVNGDCSFLENGEERGW